MIAEFSCLVCSSRNWRPVGQREYRAANLDRLPEYLRRRYRVLFEIWSPAQTTFRATFIVCNACGFLCFTPRPTREELDAKYRFLTSQHPPDIRPAFDSIEELKRGQAIASLLMPNLEPGSHVLDYGGGDGRLLAPFIAGGCHGWVIDYEQQTIPRVKHLARTLADAPEHESFDAVICSHVIEHLADPLSTLIDLRNRMVAKGLIYVEVPMEIWRALPAKDEPVTHINFFTRDSLSTLLCRAGFDVRRCRHEAYKHPAGHITTVVRAVASSAIKFNESRLPGAGLTRALLEPGLYQRMQQAWIHPGKSIRKLKRLVGNAK
ncbi:MAG TPA: class I SAM-dependent methyltransferase [Tepidisphaeraceae bacterium]|nr:class I SAM-dependent methyltransferase [Tepidisphaeraceae bacterium]